MQSPPLISVVVTTYNRSSALAQVLRGLKQQRDQNFETIIADDGSGQEHVAHLRSVARKLEFPVVHVWHPDVGFTASRVRNRGVGVSTGRYIILLDGDCVPEVDFIEQHRRLMEVGFFVNGSRVLLSQRLTTKAIDEQERLHDRSAGFWAMQRLSGHVSKLSHLVRLPDWQMRKQSSFQWKGIRSCNMGVWREQYLAVNGFDESFVGWGHEDADFVLRLHNLGAARKNGFCATEVLHLWHPEAARTHTNINRDRVLARVKTGAILPETGFTDSTSPDEVRVERLP